MSIRPVVVAKPSARYEAADLTTPLRDWGTSQWERMLTEDISFDANVRAIVISRFRWEVRNNPFLAGIVSKFASAIGTPTLRNRTSNRDYNKAADTQFFAWSKRATVGADDADSLDTCISILERELPLTGELFVIFLANGRTQWVASEFCGSPTDKLIPNESNGIGKNSDGSVAYYRFTKSTNSVSPDFRYTNTEIVDARNVAHVFDKDRCAMGRGLPWLLSALAMARDLAEIVRAKTKQIKDASSISGVIEMENLADALKAMGNPSTDPVPPGFLPENAPGLNAPVSNPAAVDLMPGTFVPVRPGEKFNVLSTNYEAADYKELIILMLCGISAPLGLPVEIWFSGMGDVNFSGSKALGVQWADRRAGYIALFETKLLNRLYGWRAAKSRKVGLLAANPDGDDSLIKWAWKAAATLDPEREARANQTKLASGEWTMADVWESQNKFYDEELIFRKQLWDDAQRIGGIPKSAPPITFLLGASAALPNNPAAQGAKGANNNETP